MFQYLVLALVKAVRMVAFLYHGMTEPANETFPSKWGNGQRPIT
jgi:hypothetical protein